MNKGLWRSHHTRIDSTSRTSHPSYDYIGVKYNSQHDDIIYDMVIASAALLNAVYAGTLQLMLSVPLALEYEAKCTLQIHYQAAGISHQAAQNFVNAIIALSHPVQQHFFWRPQLRDLGDEMVLETAVNGRAFAIVTFNIRDYGEAPKRFGIEVLQPKQAIWRIRQ